MAQMTKDELKSIGTSGYYIATLPAQLNYKHVIVYWNGQKFFSMGNSNPISANNFISIRLLQINFDSTENKSIPLSPTHWLELANDPTKLEEYYEKTKA